MREISPQGEGAPVGVVVLRGRSPRSRRQFMRELLDGGGDSALARSAQSFCRGECLMIGAGELARGDGASLEPFVAAALENQVGGAPDNRSRVLRGENFRVVVRINV
jgi:hypothetical protein